MKSYDGSGLKDLKNYLAQDLPWDMRTLGRFLWHHRGVVATLLLLFIAFVAWLRPLPPARAYLATGQPGSSYHALATRMQALFAGHGLDLVLVESPGLEQGFVQLRDDGDPVDASFMTAGSKKAGEYADLVSLGSIRHAPLWLFHRHTPPGANPFLVISQQRVAVGLPGSTTLALFEALLRANGRTLADAPLARQLPEQEALEQFRTGALDAVFLVDGVDADSVQHLLALPQVRVLDFGANDAYLRKIPYLKTVTLARASVDLPTLNPPEDQTLLASTITLLVEKKMHPAHQWAFLLAIQQLSEEQGSFFAQPGYFPAYNDKSVPLSAAARVYFERGVPASFRYLPLWLAALYERLWLVALAVLAPLVPLALALRRVRDLAEDRHVDGVYQRMYDLGQALERHRRAPPADVPESAAACRAQFAAVKGLVEPLIARDPRKFDSLRKSWNELVVRVDRLA